MIFLLILTMNIAMKAQQTQFEKQPLNGQQQIIVVIAAYAAIGEIDRLKKELNSGPDGGLTVNQIKEMLVQLYAYCGFPKSLIASFEGE